jgi:hypothetical protein
MKTSTKLLIFMLWCFVLNVHAQAITLTPQGNTSSQFSLSTTLDVSQTGTPTVSQLIYNTNAGITDADANGIGYYFWNGTNWKSLDANIPQSTIIFSETHPNQSLINAGFSMIGTTQVATPSLDVWRRINMQNAPTGAIYDAAPYFNKFYFLGNTNNGRGIYDPETDQWTKIDSVNAPSGNFRYAYFKDRVFAINQTNANNSRIYNPNSNTWVIISTINAPTDLNSYIYYTATNTDKNRNFIFTWTHQEGSKVLDLINNTWNNVSATNAPIIPINANPRIIPLETKVMLYFLNNNVYEFYMYDVTNNTWTSVSNTNAPLYNSDNEWGTVGLQNDSLILFFNRYYQNSSITTFKRYDVSQNLWLDDIPSLYSIGSINSYLGIINNSYYFRNFLYQPIEFNNTSNQWKIIQRYEDDVEDRGSEAFISICNSKIIKFGGVGISSLHFHNDGYLYDTEAESWQYITSVFGKAIPNSLSQRRGAVSCNDRYLISFCNLGGYQKSGIMQLSGTTNQTTQKTLYLYKKN